MKRRQINVFLLLAVVAFSLYAAYTLITLQMEIGQKEQEAQLLQEEIELQLLENAKLQDILDAGLDDAYIEKVARSKLGLAMPGERLFINP